MPETQPLLAWVPHCGHWSGFAWVDDFAFGHRVDRYDLVILSIGVNDVTALRSPRQWLQLQDQLAKLIETRFRPQLVIHCALPPMHAFTGLPQPLRWFFGLWAQEFNRQLAGVLSGQTRRTLHQPFLEAASGGLASDGFHPGPVGYTAWAESLSKGILAARLTEQSTVSAMVHR